MPTLFIGLGGTGQSILLKIKENLFLRGNQNQRVEFLYYDLDDNCRTGIAERRGNAQSYYAQNIDFRNNEKIIPRPSPDIIGADNMNDNYNGNYYNWLSHNLQWQGPGASQNRQASRLGFFSQYNDIQTAIRNKINNLNNADRGGDPLDVVIVFSVAGGTGCGSFIDIGFLCKRLLAGLNNVSLIANAMLPEAYADEAIAIFANGYAALKELNYFQSKGNICQFVYPGNELNDDQWRKSPLFDKVFFISKTAAAAHGGNPYIFVNPTDIMEIAADYLYLRYVRRIIAADAQVGDHYTYNSQLNVPLNQTDNIFNFDSYRTDCYSTYGLARYTTNNEIAKRIYEVELALRCVERANQNGNIGDNCLKQFVDQLSNCIPFADNVINNIPGMNETLLIIQNRLDNADNFEKYENINRCFDDFMFENNNGVEYNLKDYIKNFCNGNNGIIKNEINEKCQLNYNNNVVQNFINSITNYLYFANDRNYYGTDVVKSILNGCIADLEKKLKNYRLEINNINEQNNNLEKLEQKIQSDLQKLKDIKKNRKGFEIFKQKKFEFFLGNKVDQIETAFKNSLKENLIQYFNLKILLILNNGVPNTANDYGVNHGKIEYCEWLKTQLNNDVSQKINDFNSTINSIKINYLREKEYLSGYKIPVHTFVVYNNSVYSYQDNAQNPTQRWYNAIKANAQIVPLENWHIQPGDIKIEKQINTKVVTCVDEHFTNRQNVANQINLIVLNQENINQLNQLRIRSNFLLNINAAQEGNINFAQRNIIGQQADNLNMIYPGEQILPDNDNQCDIYLINQLNNVLLTNHRTIDNYKEKYDSFNKGVSCQTGNHPLHLSLDRIFLSKLCNVHNHTECDMIIDRLKHLILATIRGMVQYSADEALYLISFNLVENRQYRLKYSLNQLLAQPGGFLIADNLYQNSVLANDQLNNITNELISYLLIQECFWHRLDRLKFPDNDEYMSIERAVIRKILRDNNVNVFITLTQIQQNNNNQNNFNYDFDNYINDDRINQGIRDALNNIRIQPGIINVINENRFTYIVMPQAANQGAENNLNIQERMQNLHTQHNNVIVPNYEHPPNDNEHWVLSPNSSKYIVITQ